MNQNNEGDKAAMLAMIEKINQVEGFDPAPFAVDFADLVTGEVRKRLPVMTQMAWFRMKYPEGKITVQVIPEKDGTYVATAKVYPCYKDPVEFYLAEGTASRSFMPDKPTVSPREWAQTAAIGIALRNAGFGLQFAIAGESFEELAPCETEMDESVKGGAVASEQAQVSNMTPDRRLLEREEPARELTEQEKLAEAMRTPCPVKKHAGKTLGEVLQLEPNVINWVATKYTGNEKTREAAVLLCNHALVAATA